jgi:hypothetical protein
MPRIVRNFWLTISVDGRKSDIATGPKAANGGFRCTILMRENGDIHGGSIVVEGRVHNGLLYVDVWAKNECVFRRTTKR